MFDSFIGYSYRPERTVAEATKKEDYHLQNGRWCVYFSNNNRTMEHMRNIHTNRSFYSPNKQWGVEEDFANFLMDESGQTTNRIKVEMNYIQVMGNQFIGNVCRMGVRSKAQSFSPMAKVRKEEEAAKNLIYFDAAKNSTPEHAEYLMANKPIGTSEMETQRMFENSYTDELTKGVNALLRYFENINNVDTLKREIAESMTISGMSVVKPEVYAGDYRLRWVQPERFFFDREARKYDLSDAAYMGEYEEMMLTDIYEKCYQLGGDVKNSIEAFKANYGGYAAGKPDRLRVYKVYWRDISIDRWGYVEDEYGDIVFERINYTHPDDEKPKYTEKDVVNVSKLTPHQKKIIRKDSGKAIRTGYTDQWRFVEFVPREYLGRMVNSTNKDDVKDLVLDYGVMEYQEPSVYTPFNMETPYKVGFYIYTDGYVYSPLDIAINPQRVANRMISVVENMFNNAHGSGTILPEESVNKSNYTAAEMLRRMKRNEPLILPVAMFGGTQNAVGSYDSNIGAGARNLIDTAGMFLQSIEKMTGVNEAMKGQMERPDQLVGTMQLMIQKGTVVTERFYTAIRELFRQCYQAAATSGRRFYINEKPQLVCIVGDKEADVIELSRDMMLERYRVSVDLTADEQTERQFVDMMLMQFLQIGLIDKGRFSQLMGRGNADDMYYALREHTKELLEAEAQAAQMQQEQAEMQEQEGKEMVDRTFQDRQAGRDSKMMETLIKQGGQGMGLGAQ
jgi:hypothetical protein